MLITAKQVNNSIVKLRKKPIREANLTPEQAILDKDLTNYLLNAIRITSGSDIWHYRITNNHLRDTRGNIVGAWIQISRIPPFTNPNLYEFVDFKCHYDFSEPCYLYYAFGRDKGEFRSKYFKASSTGIKQTLISIFKSLYFAGSTPNLDKVIDIRKLTNFKESDKFKEVVEFKELSKRKNKLEVIWYK